MAQTKVLMDGRPERESYIAFRLKWAGPPRRRQHKEITGTKLSHLVSSGCKVKLHLTTKIVLPATSVYSPTRWTGCPVPLEPCRLPPILAASLALKALFVH